MKSPAPFSWVVQAGRREVAGSRGGQGANVQGGPKVGTAFQAPLMPASALLQNPPPVTGPPGVGTAPSSKAVQGGRGVLFRFLPLK